MVLNSQVLKNIDNNKESNSSEIKELLEKNLQLTEEIHKMSKKMDHYIISQRVFGVVKIIIIIAPIILSIIYVPRIIDAVRADPQIIFKNTVVDSWMDGLMNAATEKIDPSQIDLNKVDLNKIDLKKLPPDVLVELQKNLKK